MRLKRSRMRDFYHRARIAGKDKEGGVYEEYAPAIPFKGEAWPAGGKVQAEQYGERLAYIYNVRLEGRYEAVSTEDGKVRYEFPGTELAVMEGDGICLFAREDQKPDYRVAAIRPHRFLRLEVERI
ncbi:MAG TPA: hypothetical protein DF613_16715 [Lachnospiraceae bacterium]|nr:hypothetical protein [Lachnospiraceae bacterium]